MENDKAAVFSEEASGAHGQVCPLENYRVQRRAVWRWLVVRDFPPYVLRQEALQERVLGLRQAHLLCVAVEPRPCLHDVADLGPDRVREALLSN